MFAPHHRPAADGGPPSGPLTDGMKLPRHPKKPDGDTDEEAPSLVRWLRVVKQGLFGVLFVMAKSSASPPLWQFFVVVAHFNQVRGRGGTAMGARGRRGPNCRYSEMAMHPRCPPPAAARAFACALACVPWLRRDGGPRGACGRSPSPEPPVFALHPRSC